MDFATGVMGWLRILRRFDDGGRAPTRESELARQTIADRITAMSIQHALLTSLLEKPSTGYQLARRFDRSIGHFWQASHQQIYRELRRMAAAGWVEVEAKGDDGSRKRKVYHVLPEGREELVRWAAEPGSSGASNEALMVKIRAEAVLGPIGVRYELERLINWHEQRLASYRAIEARDFPVPEMTRAQHLQHRVLLKGISAEEDWLQWARETLPLL
ncbi:PadR family transcriptional regulator [Marinobacter zhanjiangensis]|uniref:PadR family transcriptional regulator n=1 Tax=Marinobacter zhanjiangensis TaxID=578215 RepID=A0ABQ3B1X1_9GAMM|nr:PadR family transcriptional regulator [Marinobacter zhanjiangensis]GGY75022.1 PadR family transcriptional regulator [Marinobacter zhanjiangensis]